MDAVSTGHSAGAKEGELTSSGFREAPLVKKEKKKIIRRRAHDRRTGVPGRGQGNSEAHREPWWM